MSEEFLIVGLGNPGDTYKWTLHNAGFLALESLRVHLGFPAPHPRGLGLLTQGLHADKTLRLLWPQTFMNRSGQAVAEAMVGHETAKILVVHDELDLPLGRLRLKLGGGDGGHRGLRSLLEYCGGGEFARLRIGVGRPPKGQQAADYVLEALSLERLGILKEMAEQAAQVMILVAGIGLSMAMERVNRREATRSIQEKTDCTEERG